MSLSASDAVAGWSYFRIAGADIYNRLPLEFTSVEEIDRPERYLDKVVELMGDTKWCFGFGSALGIYRDNGFVPGDTDIDICVYDGDFEKLQKIFENEWRLVRRVYYEDRPHQLAFQDDNKFIIDLCFFYRDGDDWVSECEGGHWRDSVDIIGDTRLVETVYGSYPVPEKIDEYLESRYGDWQVPKYGAAMLFQKGCMMEGDKSLVEATRYALSEFHARIKECQEAGIDLRVEITLPECEVASIPVFDETVFKLMASRHTDL